MKRLGWMAAAAAVLLAAYVGLRAQQRRQTAAEEATRALVTLDTATVDRIVFERRDEVPARIVFERRPDGVWWLVEPIEYPASRTGIKSMLDQLGELRYARALQGVDAAQFGLGVPRYRATFYAADVSNTIAIGKDTALGAELYLMRAGNDDVLIASKGFEYQFAKEPKQWRSRSLFLDAFPATLATLEFATETSHWTLRRSDDGWYDDAGTALDYGLVQALATRISNLDVRTYLSDTAAADLAAYDKLEPPLRRLVVTASDGTRYELHFGQGPLSDGTVPVHVTWRNQLVSIAAYAYEGLWRTPGELTPPLPAITAPVTAGANALTPFDASEREDFPR